MSIQARQRNHLEAAAILTICAGLLAMPAGAAPRIVGPASTECRDTLVAANAAFYSTAFRLSDPVTLSPGGRVKILMQIKEPRIDPGIFDTDDINVDEAAFKGVTHSGDRDARKIYWQVAPKAAIRWVVADDPSGWRGDNYNLYAVDPSETEDGFAPLVNKVDPRQVMGWWIPPMILRDRFTDKIWAVDHGRFDVPDVWTVYAAGKNGVQARCTIAFGPKVKTAFDLLPTPVRALAVDLDGTVGDGRDEGSLHQTGRIRTDVAQDWINIALRPRAVTNKPYHSRREADLGLRHWSHGAASFRTLYLRIQADYPAAVDALAELYVKRFDKTPEAARALATHNLDIVYRNHFVFSQDFIHPKPPARPVIAPKP